MRQLIRCCASSRANDLGSTTTMPADGPRSRVEHGSKSTPPGLARHAVRRVIKYFANAHSRPLRQTCDTKKIRQQPKTTHAGIRHDAIAEVSTVASIRNEPVSSMPSQTRTRQSRIRCQSATPGVSWSAFRYLMTSLTVQMTSIRVQNDNDRGCRHE